MSEHGGGGGETSYNSVAGGTVVHGSVIQAHRIESLHIDQYVPPPARQLPHDTGPFVNRVRELDQLHSVARTADGPSGPRTVLLTGLGGIGKTKLVAHWAHLGDLREWFPRHLYVDLEEMRRDGAVDVAAVLRGFLTGLGVHRELLPTDRPGLTALYRSMTATGRVLVVVDNAQHAAEVRGLTPGQGLLVVTSRKLLTALVTRNGAVPIVVEPLDKTAGVELVREWSKDAAETTAAELVRLCGGLPLALLTAGDWLADRPHLGLEHVVRTLAAEDLLTADPTDGSPSMSSVLDAVHDQLPVAAQRLYALVGAADLVDLTHPLARVAAGSDADADTAIGALVNAHLVTHTGEGHDRYRPHDLVRAHARAVAGRLSAPERQELLADAVDLYVDLTAHADQVVGGSGRFRMQPRPRPVGHDLFGTRAQALDWLDAESANLRGITRAAMAGERHDAVWRICESLWPWFNARRPFAAWLELQDRGVEAAQWLGRRDVEVRMRNQLARHHYTLRAFDDAERELAVADALLDLVDDAVLHGMVHETRGLTALAVGRDQDALALFERALHANRRAGDAHGIAVQTYNLAQARIAAGDFTAALALLDEVTALTDTGSPMRTKIDLVRARALRGLGDLDAALDAAITAAELAAAHGLHVKLTEAMTFLADLTEGAAEPLRTVCADKLRIVRRAAGVIPDGG
ncbi:hypothetical protein AB0J38_32345 [Streptomyces sp. NPDC050095]|uniref:hypothetical protein n=1 Tax=unclassified Streptomyces TaxID=2593676 RepID=UPI0034417891